MNSRIAVLSVFVGMAMVSFSTGQGKPVARSTGAPDDLVSDHDRIEKLQVEVAELQKKLAALAQRCGTHTHRLRAEVAQLPGRIECNQTVVQWAPAGLNRGSVDRVCRQLGDGDISVLATSSRESIVTGPPGP